MYIPNNMLLQDQQAITDFIRQHGFGLLVGPDLTASHLPLLLQPNEGSHGVLYGHLARANPQWQQLEQQRVLVVFSGPHSYISPNWYQSKPAVPTWNYAAVHCYGRVELLGATDTLAGMQQLIKKYEPSLLQDQDKMPAAYQQKLAAAVVGFRIVLDDIQAKEKLGQHRRQEDQAGVYQALKNSAEPDATALAAYMAKRGLGLGLA